MFQFPLFYPHIHHLTLIISSYATIGTIEFQEFVNMIPYIHPQQEK